MAKNANALYSWNFEDTHNRSPLWYLIAFSIGIGLIIWGFMTRQYGMSIVIMLIIGFFFYVENNAEDEVQVDITDLGIKVQDIFYDFARIRSYTLIYSGENALYLRLSLQKRGLNIVNLKVDNTIASNLRRILPNYIEEETQQEITFIERILHLLKL